MQKYRGVYSRVFKRCFDVVASLLVIIVFSPVLAVTAVLVRAKLGSPVLFRQKRPGKDEKLFGIMKFRTMTDEHGENGELLPDEVRLTRFGSFLRAASIDELPEFFNILNGDMSLIGPRPLLESYLPLYSPEQHRRHSVRPGLSGLAQVNGRNLLSWEEKFRLDIEYVDNITLRGDIKIILMTLKNVIRREGINSETAATMEPFVGNVHL